MRKLIKILKNNPNLSKERSEEMMGFFKKHMPRTKDIALITLKGHLMAEDILDQIIIFHCISPKSYKDMNLSFSKKICMCEAILGKGILGNLAEMLNCLNSLRNELAHTLEDKKLEVKLSKFIESVNGEGCTLLKDSNLRSKQLKASISYMLGFMSAFESVIFLELKK